MTREEKALNSVSAEVQKIQDRIEKKKVQIQKNQIKCEKLGCSDWTEEEWDEKRKVLMKKSQEAGSMWMQFEEGFLTEKQNDVLWNKFVSYPNDMNDLVRKLECTLKRQSKAEIAFYGVQEKIEEQESIEKKEESWLNAIQKAHEEYEEWLKQFKTECLADGVVIDEATNSWISGTTKSGKEFHMYINDGWTERSFHCYTLRIEGETIFTSGLFTTAYRIIKR